MLDDERMHEFTGGRPLTLDALRSRYRRLAVGHATNDSELWLNWVVRLSGTNQSVGVMQATVAADSSTAHVAWEIGVPFQVRASHQSAATQLCSG